MRNFLFYIFTFFILTQTQTIAQHTFSIVAVDPATGEIGSAGATCISAEDGAITISDIVLGVGAIHTQSYWSPANQNNAKERMISGDSPEEIISWLENNDVNSNPSIRQYNIVDLKNGDPRAAAFTGSNCFREFIHITGPNYAIAGNILISEDVVKDMETGFLETEGTLSDKLMGALQGAKRPGADERCLAQEVSSASAFIRVAQPSDTDASLGNLSLDINVWISNEIFEPIDGLQNMYDLTVITNEKEIRELSIFPNPASKVVNVQLNSGAFDKFSIFDLNGKVVISKQIPINQNATVIDVSQLNEGAYILQLSKNNVIIERSKVLISRK